MERGQKAYEAWCKEIFGGAGDWECVGRKDRWAAVEAACAPQMPADVAALVKRLEAGLEGLPAGPWKHVPWHIAEGGSEVRVAEGWLLCCTSADGYARHIANCDPDTIRALLSALQAQAAEIAVLKGEVMIEHCRAEAAEAKLREAVKMLQLFVRLAESYSNSNLSHYDAHNILVNYGVWDAARAFLASMEQTNDKG